MGRARRELTAATVLVNSAALPEDACGLPGPVCSGLPGHCADPHRGRGGCLPRLRDVSAPPLRPATATCVPGRGP